MLFGQFVGDWVIARVQSPSPRGVAFATRGEVHFGWILEGRAVQDVWMTYDEKSKKVIPVGTTVRVYNPSIDAWLSTWISAIRRSVQTFVARQVREKIVLEGTTNDGYPERWIFSEIKPESFRWYSEETHDGGNTWVLTEEMRIRRRNTGTETE